MLGYNKVCNIEDFTDADFVSTMKEVFEDEVPLYAANYPAGVADSRQWEVAMAVRTLRDQGCFRRDARILGVAAGTGTAGFYFTRRVGEVIVADTYGRAGGQADQVPAAFLTHPAAFASIPFERRRLIPMYMDGRCLHFEDASFDAVYETIPPEGFASSDQIAAAAFEMGRVLKPGGIASCTAMFKVAGPPGLSGWAPQVMLFAREDLQRLIVDASGLEMVDAPAFEISERTMAVRRDLSPFMDAVTPTAPRGPQVALAPNVIRYYEGYLFASVHLALRKPLTAESTNAWAAPSDELRKQVDTRAHEAASLGGALLQQLHQMHEEDDHIRWLKSRVQVLDAEFHRDQAQIQRLNEIVNAAGLQHSSTEAEHWKREYDAVKSSLSWRITAPLRFGLDLLTGRLGRKS